MQDTAYLYDTLGRRLYLTSAEREAFLRTALGHDRPVRTLCSVLYYTGCRNRSGGYELLLVRAPSPPESAFRYGSRSH